MPRDCPRAGRSHRSIKPGLVRVLSLAGWRSRSKVFFGQIRSRRPTRKLVSLRRDGSQISMGLLYRLVDYRLPKSDLAPRRWLGTIDSLALDPWNPGPRVRRAMLGADKAASFTATFDVPALLRTPTVPDAY